MNTNTELSLINTTANSGTITLPLASSIPGRVVEFKDSIGKFGTNTLTVNTSGSDTFEDGGKSKILKESYGSIQLVASNGKWYLLNGTQVNTLQLSTLNVATISSINISTSAITASSITFKDNRFSTNFMNVSTSLTSTSFLYYDNYIVAGTRVGYSNLLNSYLSNTFKPTYINGLVLWLDGSDITTLFQDTAGTTPVTATGQNVNFWKDKSPISNNAITTSTSPYNNPPVVNFNSLNGYSVLTFAGSNGYNLTPTKVPYGPNYATYFYICNTTNTASEQTVMFTNQYANFTGRRHHFNNNRMYLDLTNGYFATDSTTFLNTYNMASAVLNSFENGWINGIPFNQTNNLPIVMNGLPLGAQIGYLDIFPLFGNIGEIIVFNYDLSTLQRQQVEGYLAWKWGLQTKLPVNHPYRYFSP
jgi:hypothetical protein